MRVCDYLVEELVKHDVTDSFGIPGGVILQLLYAMQDRKEIEPHLTYHEQTAAFAALGYAQASGKLGVAYATKGPGICNMFTAIAEAFQESLPVLFITAHGEREETAGVRFCFNQEMDISKAVRSITKFSANIDDINQVVYTVKMACRIALSGRCGPTLIDMSAALWNEELISCEDIVDCEENKTDQDITHGVLENIQGSRRPVILIGDGLRHTVNKKTLLRLAENLKLPILSSRASQDLLSGSPYYYGYIGSHGVRYGNFILSKADCIISIGNRMAFPLKSISFATVVKNVRIVRVDIDEGELRREFPHEIVYRVDSKKAVEALEKVKVDEKAEWIQVCERLRKELDGDDCTEPVRKIVEFLSKRTVETVYVCDVGNNEFWFSRAYEKSKCTETVLVSKAFGTLGAALGKSIGVYYATKKNVVCVIGDQGFQYNIQELQFLAQHDLPIQILLLNNNSSGMIADHENGLFNGRLLHVTNDTGYSTPDFKEVATAYGVEEHLIQLLVDKDIRLTPTLPKKSILQDMEPSLERKRYEELDKV